MQKIKIVSGVLAVSRGARLELSEAQAISRRHHLDSVLDDDRKPLPGLFVARVPLQFKTGEELGVIYEDIGKGQRDQVELISGAQGEFATEPPKPRDPVTSRDPLDHDGDGRKGGSRRR